MRLFLAKPLAALILAACDRGPATITDLHDSLDWNTTKGAELQSEWDKGVKRILMGIPRPDAIDAINAAGFECTYGEAHEDYPDPMAVCTRSFATRACQLDWEIASTADKAKVDSADATFTRDCVGTTDDWPEPKESEIDNQLAPPNLPN